MVQELLVHKHGMQKDQESCKSNTMLVPLSRTLLYPWKDIDKVKEPKGGAWGSFVPEGFDAKLVGA